MEARRQWPGVWLWILNFSLIFFIHCDARNSIQVSKDVVSSSKNPNVKHLTILEVAKNLNMIMDISVKDSSNPQPYVSSPLTLPPYDSLSPMPLPDNNNSPPFCVFPPPQSPTTTNPSPIGFSPTPPSPSSSNPDVPALSPSSNPTGSSSPYPPIVLPGPPSSSMSPPVTTPSPFILVPNPPYYEPSPPSGDIPGPPFYEPSPPFGFAPGPPVFQPPVVYPPPASRTPPTFGGGGIGGGVGGGGRVWCVAKPAVPDPIIQEAMSYACGSGADCGPIQPSGSCYQPNTLLEHASYAFNSYWQRTKAAGGTCDFGGTAILVTADPSSQGCHFLST